MTSVSADRGQRRRRIGGPLALELPEQHLPDPRHEVQLGRPHQREVFQQCGQVTLGAEVGRAPVAERAVQGSTTHDVAHRHEVERDRGGRRSPNQFLFARRHILATLFCGYIAPLGAPVLPDV